MGLLELLQDIEPDGSGRGFAAGLEAPPFQAAIL